MVTHVVIDTLTLRAREFAVRRKDLIRENLHLRHLNKVGDKELIEEGLDIFPLLGRILDRGPDPSRMGSYFVKRGKIRVQEGIPVSEAVYAINLAEQIVIEYIMTEFAPENPLRMYESMRIITRVANFFILGCFYMIKGFLEAIYTKMNRQDSLSEEFLKKYFRDDFFFKNDDLEERH